MDIIQGIPQSKTINLYTQEDQAAAGCPDVRRTAAAGLSLGNTTRKVSLGLDEAGKRRILRYFLQNVASSILPGERVASCSRVVLPGQNFVKIMYSSKVKRAHYKNLMVCGSVWSCPVCAAKITERRREELASGLASWTGGLVMAAFTFQHTRDDHLKQLRDFLNKAYKRVQAGCGWVTFKDRWGIVGTIGSAEVTWGPESGWHQHKHVLFFTKKKLNTRELEEFETELSNRYCGVVKQLGGYAHPLYGVRVTPGVDPKDYVCKWGLDYELTKSPVKKARGENYSPFELLERAATGDYQAVVLYREYCQAMKGSKQLSYSHGLRKLLQLGIEKSEEELATEEREDAILLAQLARDAWSIIVRRQLRGQLLEIASSGDAGQIEEFLISVGLLDVYQNALEGH